MEKVPLGFGAPGNPHVLAHGVLHIGWQPKPETAVLPPAWPQVDCCLAAHNESYINGLSGHLINEECLLTLNCPCSMEACPISRATHFKREGQFRLPLIYIM